MARALRERGKPAAVRRKLRVLVQKDVDVELTDLPRNVDLRSGSLAASLTKPGQLMQQDLDGFVMHYERKQVRKCASILPRTSACGGRT
ncbi:MAG TPA: hypothetical protein VGM27_29150 [Acidobacteriaceae bacterium]